VYWLIASLIVAGGIIVGWCCAWLVHRYEEDLDSHTAVFGTANCEHCDHELLPGPLAARLGRCPTCDTRVPGSWFVTTLAVPVFGLAMLATWGQSLLLIPFLWLVPVLVVASMVDIRLLLIPRRVAWVGFAVGLLLIVPTAIALGMPASIQDALIGTAIYFGLLYVVWLITPRGMGFGDVRLAAVLGLYLGWINIRLPLISLFFACIIGVVLGLGYRMIVRDGSKFFPFGPGLAIGALVAIWFWQPLVGYVST
jgi:leader peptidase (prepilin peptidase)/N-methyltransferase